MALSTTCLIRTHSVLLNDCAIFTHNSCIRWPHHSYPTIHFTKAPSSAHTSRRRCIIDATVLPSVVNNRHKFQPNELTGSLLYVLLPTIIIQFCFCIEENVRVFRLWHRRIVTDLWVWSLCVELIGADRRLFEMSAVVARVSPQTDAIPDDGAEYERDDDAEDGRDRHVWRRVAVALRTLSQRTCQTNTHWDQYMYRKIILWISTCKVSARSSMRPFDMPETGTVHTMLESTDYTEQRMNRRTTLFSQDVLLQYFRLGLYQRPAFKLQPLNILHIFCNIPVLVESEKAERKLMCWFAALQQKVK